MYTYVYSMWAVRPYVVWSPGPRLLLRQCQREALDLEGDHGTMHFLEICQWIGEPWENNNQETMGKWQSKHILTGKPWFLFMKETCFFHNMFPETNLLNGKQKTTGKPMAMDVYTNECWPYELPVIYMIIMNCY